MMINDMPKPLLKSVLVVFVLVLFSSFFFFLLIHKSPVAKAFNNIALHKHYQISPLASIDNIDRDGKLTDGQYASVDQLMWRDIHTVGWKYYQPIVITIDLRNNSSIRGISYSTAADAKSDVHWPGNIFLLTSDDGKTFYYCGDLVELDKRRVDSYVDLSNNQYSLHRFWTDALKTHGRYVQLIINPVGSFHSYVYCDGIEIYQGNDDLVNNKNSEPGCSGGILWYNEKVTELGIQKRLLDDCLLVMNKVQSSSIANDKKMVLNHEILDCKKEIESVKKVNIDSFRAILPLNKLEEKIFSVNGKLAEYEKKPEM